MLRAEGIAFATVFLGGAALSLARASFTGDRALGSRSSVLLVTACAACGYVSLSAAPGLAGATGVAAVAVAAWTDAIAQRIYHVLSVSAALTALAARITVDGGVVPSLVAGLALAAFFAAWRWLRGAGGGDIGIALVCGLAFGPVIAQEVLLVGAFAALAVMTWRTRGRDVPRGAFVPLAPFLLVGIVVVAAIPAGWRVA